MKLSKKQQKQAQAMAKRLIEEQPFADLVRLELDADYDTDCSVEDRAIRLEAIQILNARNKAAKAMADKLEADLKDLGMSDYHDVNVALENMPSGPWSDGPGWSVDYWPEFSRQIFNVVAVRAQDDGIDINAKLGYAIY
jgi:DNA repair ATPase RecN